MEGTLAVRGMNEDVRLDGMEQIAKDHPSTCHMPIAPDETFCTP